MAASIYGWSGLLQLYNYIIVMKTAERPHFLNLWQESIKMKKKFLFKVVRINIDRIVRLKNQFYFYRDFRHFGNWKIYIAATYTWIRIRIQEYVFKKTCLRWFVSKIYVLALERGTINSRNHVCGDLFVKYMF